MSYNLKRGILSILGSNVGRLFLSLIITPILVRLLGPKQFGEYAFVLSIISFSSFIVISGITDGVRKFVAEKSSNPEGQDRVLGYYLKFGALISLGWLFLIGIILLLELRPTTIGNQFTTYILVAGLVVVARQFFLIFRSALMGKGFEHMSEPLRVVQSAIFGVIGLFLVYIGYGVVGALTGHLIAAIVASGITIILANREYNIMAGLNCSNLRILDKNYLRYNLSNTVFLVLTVSLYHVDILLLQLISGGVKTGYYKAALTVAEFLWFVPIAVQTALLHSTSELWSNNQTEEITRIASKVTKYTSLLTSLLAIGLLVLAPRFVPWYFGSDFASAIQPLMILIPGSICFAVSRPIYSIGQGKGDFKPLIFATGGAASLNLILNLTWIPKYGMIGAAAATSVGYGSMLVFHSFASWKIGFNPFRDLRIVRVISTSIFTLVVLNFVSEAVTTDFLAFIVIPIIGLFAYVIFAYLTGALAIREIKIAYNWIHSLIIKLIS